MFRLSENHGVVMIDGDIVSFVPMTEANPDYQRYLAWLEEGNTPEPWPDPTE